MLDEFCVAPFHGGGFSCHDCKGEKKEKKERVSPLLQPIYYVPPTLVDLGGPEGPGRGYAHDKAREIMGPAPDEIQRNMMGQIVRIGP